MQKLQPSVNPRLKSRLLHYFHRLHVFLASLSDDEKFKMRHLSFEKPASSPHGTTDSVEKKTPQITSTNSGHDLNVIYKKRKVARYSHS
jgi:hypothetical protein